MAERGVARLWGLRIAFICLALLILFAHLLPLQMTPRQFAGPDLVVTFAFAWAVRRPEFAGIVLLAVVLLLFDLVLHRPPGLWAALALMAVEWMKSQSRRLRETNFVAEWLTVAFALALITLIYRLILALVIVSPGSLFLVLVQYGMTVITYPIVVAVTHVLFGVRHTAPGEYDTMGRAP